MRLTDMFILGLTGGIATGKSEISRILSGFGAAILDADAIHHRNQQAGGAAYEETVASFGAAILAENGSIDRKKLGSIVFSDPEKLRLLNEISHKHVTAEIEKEIEKIKAANNHSFIVIDAPLLIEAEEHKLCCEVWLVYCGTEERIRRLGIRNCMTREEAQRRIERQTPFEELRPYADVIIDNSGGTDELWQRVTELYNKRIKREIRISNEAKKE